MKKAIVNVPICPLYLRPDPHSELADEALYGMVVEVLEEPAPGWCRVRTHYRYEGYAPASCLLYQGAEKWEALNQQVIFYKNTCGVLSEPSVRGYTQLLLPRGARVAPAGEPRQGWQSVILADGSRGYVQRSVLGPLYTAPSHTEEAPLRQALVDTAMLYAGTHYRWGGKTPLGIDCSGLVSMAYMLNGVLIYRDAHIRPDFPIREISRERMAPGDLLFFPGHVAMYLGEGRYCHSTGRTGDDGFAVNSLDPAAPDYRSDLADSLTQVGSLF